MENSTPPLPPTEDTETVTFPPLACDGTSDTFILFIYLPPFPSTCLLAPTSPPLASFALLFFLMPPIVSQSREDSGPPIDLHCDLPRRARPAVNLPISQEQVDNKATPSSFPGYLSGDTSRSQGRVRADRPHRKC